MLQDRIAGLGPSGQGSPGRTFVIPSSAAVFIVSFKILFTLESILAHRNRADKKLGSFGLQIAAIRQLWAHRGYPTKGANSDPARLTRSGLDIVNNL